ncbi:class I SAM-dependent methyltransferase [Anaeromyxobacter terrae]|uniref:class I SAM-dependent methyltransferase n=1 Tax=Anaeromyxobacter terrae TaxID=2925406 RepID=UPI001F55FE49|nr:class I SAM-dependent methyltransferase [Anaeromyxobacter sp. SG22]
MTFAVAASAYDRFIGRYSRELAPRFLDFAKLTAGPVLDVGCGPGALTAALAERFGPEKVAAVDLSEPFVAACRARVPGADVRLASAEALPFADRSFEAALSQLVLSFVKDPERMAAELHRVVRRDGTAAACMFEADGFALVRTFWKAATRADPKAPDDARLPFRRTPELVALWERAGFRDVATGVIDVEARYADFDDLWAPFAFGIGPTGGYLAAQPEDRRAALRDACFELLGAPTGPFSLPARVIAVRGRV